MQSKLSSKTDPRKSTPYCELVTPSDLPGMRPGCDFFTLFDSTKLYTLKIDSALVEKDDLATSTTTTTSSSTSTSGLEKASTRITIRLLGYKAFYYLFRYATQRPEFWSDEDNIIYFIFERYIKNDDPKNEDQLNWLIPRILTAPELALGFAFLHLSDNYFELLIDSTIKATKSGLTNIGSNATEVFEYYFNKNPRLIIRYIRCFIKKGAQPEDILRILSSYSFSSHFLLSEKDVTNLLRISTTENKEIIVYKNKFLNNLWYNVFINVMRSSYMQSNFYILEESILKRMVENRDSDSDILKILSISGLNYLQTFLEKNGDFRAFWFISKIEEELANRKKNPDHSVIPTIDNQLIPLIKRRLFKGGSTFAEYLSPAVLHELNEQFDIKNTILNKLLITQALIRQESCSERLIEECAVAIEVDPSNAEAMKAFPEWLKNNVDLKYLESERLKEMERWRNEVYINYRESCEIIFSSNSSFAETIKVVSIIKSYFETLIYT